MENWVDFKKVKEAVSMEMVLSLSRYSIELRRVNATYLRGACPLPTHNTEGSQNSFGVSTDKNAWACHVKSCVEARGGSKGGNVLDFVAVMEGCTIRDGALKLQDWFGVEASNEKPSDYVRAKDREVPVEKVSEAKADTVSEDDEDGAVNQPLTFTLKSVDSAHPYLSSRGIKESVAKCFGVGFFHGKSKMMHGRLVIPIHNERGELLAYAGRSVNGSEPKYKFPSGFRKSLVLFNLHRVSSGSDRGVVVVEGFFDSMKLHQAGFPSVVALMGSSLSLEQEELLVERFDRVVLMLDGDEVGKSAVSEIASRLMRKVFVRVVDVPDGKQPDELSSGEIQKLLASLGKGGNGSG